MDKANKIKIPSKNVNGKDREIEVVECMNLLCYSEPEHSDLAFLLSIEQRQVIASLVNNELISKLIFDPLYMIFEIEFGNKSNKRDAESKLEKMLKQLTLC